MFWGHRGSSDQLQPSPTCRGLALFYFYKRPRGSAPTRAHHQCWNVYWLDKFPHTAEEGEGNLSFKPWPTLIQKVVHASIRPSRTNKIQRHTVEKKERPHSEEGTKCSNCPNNQPLKRTSSLLDRNEATPHELTFLRPFFHNFSLSLQILSPLLCPSLSQPVHGERKPFPEQELSALPVSMALLQVPTASETCCFDTNGPTSNSALRTCEAVIQRTRRSGTVATTVVCARTGRVALVNQEQEDKKVRFSPNRFRSRRVRRCRQSAREIVAQ